MKDGAICDDLEGQEVSEEMNVGVSIQVVWDALPYMSCFYWLMNKAVSASDLAE